MNAADSLELVALSVKQRAARCLVLGTERLVTFRADRVWSIIPGEIITMKLRKQWSYGGHPYVSGNIVSTRVDAKALNLVPLRLGFAPCISAATVAGRARTGFAGP